MRTAFMDDLRFRAGDWDDGRGIRQGPQHNPDPSGAPRAGSGYHVGRWYGLAHPSTLHVVRLAPREREREGTHVLRRRRPHRAFRTPGGRCVAGPSALRPAHTVAAVDRRILHARPAGGVRGRAIRRRRRRDRWRATRVAGRSSGRNDVRDRGRLSGHSRGAARDSGRGRRARLAILLLGLCFSCAPDNAVGLSRSMECACSVRRTASKM